MLALRNNFENDACRKAILKNALTVIQTLVNWNLLSEVLTAIDRTYQTLKNTIVKNPQVKC